MRKRKTRWTLRHLKIEVNLLIAKVGLLFSKEELPKRARSARVRQGQRIVRAEYRIIQADAPKNIRPYVPMSPRTIRPTSSRFVSPFGKDASGLSKNILGDTVLALAGGVRVKAIREGDVGSAIAAAIVEQVVLDSAKKTREGTVTGQPWR